MYDVFIKGGHVIDGTGSPWRKTDVGISGERSMASGFKSIAVELSIKFDV